MTITRFEELIAWQKARELTRSVYALTVLPAFAADFGLKDQIRRASGSTMHNVAEGFDSASRPDFLRFLNYAQRSASEVQSQLYVALDQEYISKSEFARCYALAGEVKNTIGGLMKYLKSCDPKNLHDSSADYITSTDFTMEFADPTKEAPLACRAQTF